MNVKKKMARWGLAAALFGAVFGGCSDYNPTFEGFVENALDPENRKAFFSYDIRFPNVYGLELDSAVRLVSLDSGEDVFAGKRLHGWDDPVYFENAEPYRRLFGTEKIFFGNYKLIVQIGNPSTYALQEKVFWLSPGQTYAYTVHLSDSDF